jgi:CRP/FNR family transcriptional regulator, dissimilatory nitrate respiration regulator
MENIYQKLQKISLFNFLSEEELSEYLPEDRMYVRHYIPGNIMAFADDPVESLYCLTKGECRGEMLDFSGRSFTVETITAPDTVASAFLFATENRFPVNVVAVTTCEIVLIPRDFIFMITLQKPEFIRMIIRDITDRTVILAKKIQMLSFRTIRQKLVRYLLSLRKNQSLNVRVPVSREAMADLFNVERPSVSRVLSELHREGLIHVNGRDIELKNFQKLNEILIQG